MSIKTKLSGLQSRLRFDNRVQLILDRLCFSRSRFIPHRLNGVDFIADRRGGDQCGLWPCLVEGMYDPFLSAAGLSCGGPPLKVLDLGSNAGGFSLIFAARGFSIAKVVAVEMNPLTFARMQLNLLTTYGPCANAVNAVIGPHPGTARVTYSDGSTGERFEHSITDVAFEVPVMTVDQLMNTYYPAESVDVIKIDIEGSEWAVLDSPSCQRLKDCSMAIIEIHEKPGRSPEQFIDLMRTFGFVDLSARNRCAPGVRAFARR
jgi:FkbM family methyltransferase